MLSFLYVLYCTVGQRSDDAMSPSYIPSIFSFTTPRKRRELEQGLGRYQAAERRRTNKEGADTFQETFIPVEHHQEQIFVYPPNTVCCCTQTDLTSENLVAVDNDYQQRVKELSEVRGAKGYPDQEKLKDDEKLLRFYTGLNSLAVFNLVSAAISESPIIRLSKFQAVFNLVSAAISESPIIKLSKFQAFLLKLRLNVRNYVGFRFDISASTVSRVLSKWIEGMDIRLSFLITWPDRESLRKTMPYCFRPNYGLRVTSKPSIALNRLLKSLQTCLQNHVHGHNNISIIIRQIGWHHTSRNYQLHFKWLRR